MPGLAMSRVRFAAALGAVVAGAAIGVPAATGTAAPAASTVATRPAVTYPAALTGIACRTVTDCIAVGANSPQMATAMIGERWNGTAWSRTAIPNPAGASEVSTGGVACTANHECVAVGAGYPGTGKSGSFPIAEYWNGSRWTAARAAAPGAPSLLAAVSCPTATSCYAVGDYTPKGGYEFAPLIEHWNGEKWGQLTAPVPRGTSFGELTDVSCPTATFCVAAGTDGAGALIERWNGHAWSATVPRSASPAVLYGVSCPSATSCFAVGSDEAPAGGSLVERWNGSTWTGSVTPVPTGASYPGLASVSCVSPTRCLAVGNDLNPGVYAASWNGQGWHLISMTATGGHLGLLDEVRCLTATSCVALAATTQLDVTKRSESAFWNGMTWKIIPTA